MISALIFAGASGCSKAAKKARVLAQADRDFQSQKYDKAEIEYLNALRIPPLSAMAVRQVGIIYFEQNRLSEAYPFLLQARGLEPENIEVRVRLGSIYLLQGKFKEAREEAMGVLTKERGNEKALLLLASSATNASEIQATSRRIQKLQQEDKDKPGYHLAFGSLYLRQRDAAKAEVEFKKALSLDPKSDAAHVALGNLYWIQNDLKRAEQEFKTAADASPWRSSKRIKYVDFQLKTGKTAEAKKALDEITRQAPDYLPATIFQMQLALAERRYDDCAALVKKILSRDPTNYDALSVNGNIYLAKGEGDNARKEFERLNTIYSGKIPSVHQHLALAYLMNNDMAKAMASLNQAVTLNPDFPEAALLLAELNIRKGVPAVAIPLLAKVTKQHPQMVGAHLLLATAYLGQGNNDEAIAVYRKMMTLFPTDPQPPMLKGVVLMQGGKFKEARRAFENSVDISADYLPAVEQLVTLDLIEKDSNGALVRVQKQIQQKPTAAEPWLLLARTQMAQGKKAEAEASLQKCLSLDPGLRPAYFLLVQLYLESNRQQEALTKLAKLIEKTNDTTALMQMGQIHEGSKNFALARDTYEKALAVNPRFSPALNNLAYLYSEHFGQNDKAYEMAQRARQLLPEDPYVADTLGWVLFKRGDYSRALSVLKESAGSLPGQAEAQYHVGMTYYMLGEETLARLALEKAVQSKDEFPGKEEARQRLAVLAIDDKDASGTVLATLEKRVRDQPRDVVTLSRLAAIYERNGAIDKATKSYEAALKLNPINARLALKLSQLYSGDPKNQQKALDFASQAHNAAPDDAQISYTLGRLVYQMGDYKRALSLIQEAALKMPNQPGLLYDLAWSYYSVGRVGDAEATLLATLQAAPSFSKRDEANLFLAMINAGKNTAQAKEASVQVEKAISLDANYLPALVASALLQEDRGNYQGAKQIYDKILARYPFFTPAIRRLAFLYADRLNNDEKAYELALKARIELPGDADLARTLGILAYRRGDYSKAAQLLKESAGKREGDAALFYYLGLAQYRLKDKAGSKASFQKALALNLPGNLAGDAKQKLAELK